MLPNVFELTEFAPKLADGTQKNVGFEHGRSNVAMFVEYLHGSGQHVFKGTGGNIAPFVKVVQQFFFVGPTDGGNADVKRVGQGGDVIDGVYRRHIKGLVSVVEIYAGKVA